MKDSRTTPDQPMPQSGGGDLGTARGTVNSRAVWLLLERGAVFPVRALEGLGLVSAVTVAAVAVLLIAAGLLAAALLSAALAMGEKKPGAKAGPNDDGT